MSEAIFTEKQYLGLNKMSIIIRMTFAIFCFVIYYFRFNYQKEGELYFFVGIGIIIISIFLIFILHFQTNLKKGVLILDGLWTSRRVKIELSQICDATIVPYSKYFFNRAVYNLHFKGVIRFYTRGDYAIKLTDKKGVVYLLGTQRAEELYSLINKEIPK
tara:strand:+ start:138 stop:617 length:480 start_codon:yes stop_codon:yes gene_type:complete